MTREQFLAAYERHLRHVYQWPGVEGKLERFMDSVKFTLDQDKRASWNHMGECVTAAWQEIGGEGKPTLKALRELP